MLLLKRAEHIRNTNEQVRRAIENINQNSIEMMQFVEQLIEENNQFFEKILDQYLMSGTQTNVMMERFNNHAEERQRNINHMDEGLAGMMDTMETNQKGFEEITENSIHISNNTKAISDLMKRERESAIHMKNTEMA